MIENLRVIVFRSTPIKVFILFVITFLSFSKITYANLADEYFNKSVVFFSNGDIKKGSDWLKKAAAAGNNRYQYYLGNYYHNLKSELEGLNEKENIKWRKEAFKWYLKSAKNGNAFAQNEIGRYYDDYYYDKVGVVSPDYEQAMYWYMKSFNNNFSGSLKGIEKIFARIESNKITSDNVKLKIKKLEEEGSAQNQLLLALKGGTRTRKLTSKNYMLIKDSAEQGFLLAMFVYANLAEQGIENLGIPKDKDKGLMWRKKATEHGLAEAEHLMAKTFEKGEIVAQDNKEAFRLYKSAANKGIDRAQRKMAKIYLNGLLGIKKDVSLATNWFVEADLNDPNKYSGFIKFSYNKRLAEQGDRNAQFEYGSSFQDAYLPYLEKDINKAFKWFVKSADQGHKESTTRLCDGFFYEGENQDYQKAFKWCQKATNFRDPFFYMILAEIYEKGLGVIQDYNKAFKWYLKSAKEQYSGQFQVARMYAEGRGVEQNYSEAIKWYKKEGGSSSLNNIGVMYEHGTGVIQDNVTAHLYYNLSGAKGATKGRENRDRISKKMTREEIVEAQRLAREWMNKNENE